MVTLPGTDLKLRMSVEEALFTGFIWLGQLEPDTTAVLKAMVKGQNVRFLAVGAGEGFQSLLVEKLTDSSIRICLEPNPEMRDRIKLNAEINGLAGPDHVMPIAAFSEDGVIEMFFDRTFSHLSFGQRTQRHPNIKNKTVAKVQTMRIDSMMPGLDSAWNSFPQAKSALSILWVDVEGSEIAVLNGAVQTLSNRVFDAIVIEVDPSNLTQVYEVLTSAGYGVFAIREGGVLIKFDPPDEYRVDNFVALTPQLQLQLFQDSCWLLGNNS